MTTSRDRQAVERELEKVMKGEQNHLHFYDSVREYSLKHSRYLDGIGRPDNFIIEVTRTYIDWCRDQEDGR